jgi:DNA-binding HxlR family transcriptional regulator
MCDSDWTGDVFLADCPARLTMELIANKWAVVSLLALRPGPVRHGDLLERIGGISKKMLTQTLRNLERDGLVVREVFAEVPPRVEYRLTKLGESLIPALVDLARWAETNGLAILEAQERAENAAA